jgi:hypothetical protein
VANRRLGVKTNNKCFASAKPNEREELSSFGEQVVLLRWKKVVVFWKGCGELREIYIART